MMDFIIRLFLEQSLHWMLNESIAHVSVFGCITVGISHDIGISDLPFVLYRNCIVLR